MAKVPVTTKDHTRPRSVRISAPWAVYSRGNIMTQSCDFVGEEDLGNFVTVRSGLHEFYIRETEKTRRLAMYLAAGLLALACALPIFAPAGRESLSAWIGLGLFVFAVGSMGYSSVMLASEKGRLSLSKETTDA